MKRRDIKALARCGLCAALAVGIMCLGGMISVATYVCPVLCCLLCFLILKLCGKKLAWTWFAAVCILSLILCPDKESALVFALLGYYPLIKERVDRFAFRVLWKLMLFNSAAGLVFVLQVFLLGGGFEALETGLWGILWLVLVLVLSNLTFFLTDMLLNKLSHKFQ